MLGIGPELVFLPLLRAFGAKCGELLAGALARVFGGMSRERSAGTQTVAARPPEQEGPTRKIERLERELAQKDRKLKQYQRICEHFVELSGEMLENELIENATALPQERRIQ